MQPLENWIFEAVEVTGIWMYHGHGADLDSSIGPCSWFIASIKDGYLIKKWKSQCDSYWLNKNIVNDYFWMDGLFKNLIEKYSQF